MRPAELLRALAFAADKHRYHRRKDEAETAYINHPIAVTAELAEAGVEDPALLVAAILHDTIEDTETTFEEVHKEFGSEVAELVAEVTDDKSLPKKERKRLQVEHAPSLSDRAKQLKIADKICNVLDITHHPPADWSDERKRQYLAWASEVVAGCRGVNASLERRYDEVHAEGLAALRDT